MGCCLEGVINSKKKSRVQLQYKINQEYNDTQKNNNSKIQNLQNSHPFKDEDNQEVANASISRRQSKTSSVIEIQKKQESTVLKEQGNNFFKQNKFLEAIKCYSAAISLFPDSVYYSNRAQCFRQLSNWAEVLKDSCEAIRLDHENYKAYNLKGMSQVMLSKEMDIMSDQWELFNVQGIKSMQKALDLINEIRKNQDFQLISSIQTNISKANQILNLKRAEKLQRKKNKSKNLINKLIENDNSLIIDRSEIENFLERKFQKKDQRPPDAFTCIFTLDLMVNPVITSSGLSYEKSLLEDHVKVNGDVDPTTRAQINFKKCIENKDLKSAIQDFKSKNIDSEFSTNYHQITF
ncbi:U-box protein (macronuclear) [Tetrahymena thermophila SB210]|uniref:RING-type E3 ubiquitin transferase n=1 Tax=Tetrahymena thermophila (strain SB210) TaxID=312017 RepID=Q23AR7_TETTS|nr:U-box protein [Tetrahymena thermophila SB210]EAR93625.2 U-box protein [Tetrahymena thermophila SB210]|eukprot:XP_001013870.2 U-box protein [Tetrahymena thermophila SB210]